MIGNLFTGGNLFVTALYNSNNNLNSLIFEKISMINSYFF
jgi:hypothetical protein